MSEHDEQVALFHWKEQMVGKYPELRTLYATPNAGKRSVRAGKYMVAEGLRKGVPDLCLPVPRGKYGALYIELKHGKNKPTESQNRWIKLLNQYGNKAVVAYEFEGARDEILAYLALPKPEN